MASITKYRNGWRVFVRKNGINKSATFATKAAAKDWATRMEAYAIANPVPKTTPKRPVSELFDLYMKEETPKKRSARWELIRLKAMCGMPIAEVKTNELTDDHIRQWRDDRLKTVSPATLLREWTILSAVFSYAVRVLKWLPENPMKNVERPKEPAPRERRVMPDEIERLQFVCGWNEEKCTTSTQKMFVAFLFAIETAMRAGEILGLTWKNVDLNKRTAFLPMTKNGSSRTVPLSRRAVELLKYIPKDGDNIFNMRSGLLDALFRKYRDKAGIDNLHFHDTRHEAITRLAKKLDVLDLARMVGHKNLKQLMTYYNATAEELAKKLD